MKKTSAIIIVTILILLVIICMQLLKKQNQYREVANFNRQYEEYQNKEIYGIDVVTIINKATDNNEKSNILKDEKGMYIEDNENSIKVELQLISGVDSKTRRT